MFDREACYRALQTRDRRFDGRFFVGVRSTGIYCRPICPAPCPRLENIVFYTSAAAAHEAGLRPCLRCRPECSPQLAGAQGSAPSVSRALALIADGALDGDGGVEALAARLGMGERQLRRLFEKHLGASPLSVAQTRRVLLAKQLLHETHLRMVDVAQAAGFGSLRRFNDTFRRLYGRPPSQLRREAQSDAQDAASGIALTLGYAGAYDWPAMLDFFAARAVSGVECAEPARYLRTIEVGGGPAGTLEVTHFPERSALRATIRCADVRGLPAIIARVRSLFDLGSDTSAIAAQLAHDPSLAPLIAARPGLRVPGAWDAFELAVRAVLGQQVSVAAARQLLGKLALAYGEPLAQQACPGLTHLFPRPERLAEADLAALGMPRARASALRGLAAAVLAAPDLLRADGELDAKVARLRELPGIGDWTAQYIALRALREPDAFPAADAGLLRACARADGTRPTARELLARAERWRPWRAYAAQVLWSASVPLELEPTQGDDGTHGTLD